MSKPDLDFKGIIGRTIKESQSWWPEPAKAPGGSPNVVFIVLDDVGFSQLGCYGSRIETPNMDRLASNGLLYNNFHTTALCSPTRACLLTGRNHHSAGTGTITGLSTGFPGYNMRIPKNAATIAHVLKDHGYNTFAVGKWHNTPDEDSSSIGPYDRWPLGMGFERFYGFLSGSANHWNPDLVYDNHRIEAPNYPDYHLTEDLVEKAITFISDQKQVGPDKPFFLWLAFGAGHAPHHAPKSTIEKYRGKFDQGWDKIREEVFTRQKERGIIPPETELAPNDARQLVPNDAAGVKPWETLSPEEQRLFARMQEVYAGFIDHTDHHIGRLLDFLEKIGQMENTLIFLLSDNGASREGGSNGSVNETRFYNLLTETVEENLTMIDELGGPLTYNHYPKGWAQAGNTPLKLYKQNTHEGGIRDPLIVCWPKGIKDRGGIRSQYHHVIDIVPSVYEIIGITPPDSYQGIPQKSIEGVSMAYSFASAEVPTRKEIQYYEMFCHRALWHKGWKAVAYHPWEAGDHFDNDVWELYDTEKDFSECHDLAGQYPDRVKEMVDLWWREAEKYQVLPLDHRTWERFFIDKPPRLMDGKCFTFFPNTAMIPGNVAPNVRNRSHTITAEVVLPEKNNEGVLVAHGGRFAGYALYLQNNRLVYTHNYLGIEHYTLISEREVPVGPSSLRFDFEKTGEHRGKAVLYINGEKTGEREIPRTVPVRYGPEGFEIGRDSSTPVSESYNCPFAFTGVLDKVMIKLDGNLHQDPEGDYKSEMAQE